MNFFQTLIILRAHHLIPFTFRQSKHLIDASHNEMILVIGIAELCPNWHEGNLFHFRRIVRHLFHRQMENNGSVSGRCCLGRNEIPQRINDEAVMDAVAVVYLTVFHPLKHMGMACQHNIRAGCKHAVCPFHKNIIGHRFILIAHVWQHHNNVCQFLSSCNIRHEGIVNMVHQIIFRYRNAVGAIGGRYKGKVDAIDFFCINGVPCLLRSVGTHMVDVIGIQLGNGTFQPCFSRIHAVVIGSGQQIESRVLHCVQKAVRRIEARERSVFPVRPAESQFQIADNEVIALEIPLHILKIMHEVIYSRCWIIGLLVLVIMNHDVPHHSHGDFLHHRLRSACLCRIFRRCPAAAAEQERRRQQHPPFFHDKTPLCFDNLITASISCFWLRHSRFPHKKRSLFAPFFPAQSSICSLMVGAAMPFFT